MPRVAALVLAAVLLMTAEASARTPLRLGVEDDPVFQRDHLGWGSGATAAGLLSAADAFAAGHAIGGSLLKLRATWSKIEHAPGRYELAALRAAVDDARGRGWHVLVMLTGPAPAWATGDRRVSGNRPDPARFAAFAAAVASGLAGKVDQFSIWNEPNWPRSLTPRAHAAARYRLLFRAAAPAIRRLAPDAEILIGELAPLGRPREPAIAPIRFLRQLTCRDRALRPTRRCAPLVADALALHPYTLRWPPQYAGAADDLTMGSLRRGVRLLSRLARAGALRTPSGRALPIDLTEWGFHARPRTYPAERNARYALIALELACRQPRVRSLTWYQIQGSPPGGARWDSGLLDRDGTPRPVFDALTQYAASTCPLAPPRSLR